MTYGIRNTHTGLWWKHAMGYFTQSPDLRTEFDTPAEANAVRRIIFDMFPLSSESMLTIEAISPRSMEDYTKSIKQDDALLENEGFITVCTSPYEIEHPESQSSASGYCAKLVRQAVLEQTYAAEDKKALNTQVQKIESAITTLAEVDTLLDPSHLERCSPANMKKAIQKLRNLRAMLGAS